VLITPEDKSLTQKTFPGTIRSLKGMARKKGPSIGRKRGAEGPYSERNRGRAGNDSNGGMAKARAKFVTTGAKFRGVGEDR